ncbi:MAG TPA: ribonuclease R [Bacilli bacterium]|jgi:ribonuclease R|nr:ribonuclease R [Bacilli bacterium]HPZ27598.1 ribonuclease R [Bacilli bacterium]
MKEKLLEFFHAKNYWPRSFEEIIFELRLEDQRQEVKKALKELTASYEIAVNKKGKYILPEDAGIHVGAISIKNSEYGFIGSAYFDRDFYVSKADFGGALDKDVVVFQIKHKLSPIRGMNREAKVLAVKSRNMKFVVGELEKKKNVFYIRLDRQDVDNVKIINPDDYQVGDIVKAEIVSYKPLEASIVERIGIKNDIGVDILTIAAEFDFSDRFPEEVVKELDGLPKDASAEAARRRRPSLETIITIDGADAKDLDDAVGIKKLANGNYLLGVYIADVSYYVREGSAIDLEARRRGTSVYLVNRVMPMLPPLLSNNLCSLNPQTDKLVIACEMEITGEGEVVNSDIFPSALKTKYRMTYDAVNEIIAGNPEQREKYRDLCDDIFLMLELKNVLNAMRERRGALDFDVDEGKVIVDNSGRPRDVVLVERGEGERIIEEFMLAANETVASTVYYLELPFIYRIHDEPDYGKMEAFRSLVNNLGYRSFKRRVNAKQLQQFLSTLRDEDSYLKVLLLRAMAKAVYSEKNNGHFGLGSRCYTHFTAPIRRYPDLLVHRLLRKYLFDQDINRDEWARLTEEISGIAEYASKREREAMECEYRVNDMKKAEYMANFLGERFEGIVSSVTRFGLFVMLPNTVEGFVHISNIKGYYQYDGNTMRLIGPGGNYHLGRKVTVEVVKADKKSREIDFKIVYNSNRVKGNGKRRRSKQKGRS